MVLIRSTCRKPIIDHLNRLGMKKTLIKNLGILPNSVTNRSSSSTMDSCPDLKRRRRLFHNKNQSWKRKITDLPQELLVLILHNLGSIRDCICFNAVCKSWQQIYRGNIPSRFPRQLPILMIPDHNKNTLTFLNPFTTKTKTTLFDSDDMKSLPGDSRCIGSTDGWVVFVSEKDHSLYLLNPFSSVNNRINLPTPLMPGRIVFSANPASKSDYLVAGILATGLVIFRKLGDKYWKYLRTVSQEDIISYKDRFYMVDSKGHVTSSNLGENHYPIRHVVGPPRGVVHCAETRKYLVELSGELLLVFRELDSVRTIGCKIYKLDQDKFNWRKVKDLDGNSLFLGGLSSISVSALHFPMSKTNSVYFGSDQRALDPVVVNLEDGSVKKLVYENCKNFPFWIEPRL